MSRTLSKILTDPPCRLGENEDGKSDHGDLVREFLTNLKCDLIERK